MKNILENQQLPGSEAWRRATEEYAELHPILQQFPDLKTVLDYGRWAPSGDNVQPWRFKLLDEQHFDIHAFDTREHCVYDLQGHASQLSLGMLIENLSLGAAMTGQKLEYQLDSDSRPEQPVIHITLTKVPANQIEVLSAQKQLASQVILRTVHRRPLSRKKLTLEHKQQLEQAASPLKVIWFEKNNIYKTTRLFFDAAGIRLRIPEAFNTHAGIIEWEKEYSRNKMPVKTLGASWLARKMMHFALEDWHRVKFLNTWLAGTLLPRIELDVIPGLFSGAHFILLDDHVNKIVPDFIRSGRLVQRFWLSASLSGIQLQPQMTPLIFAAYQRLSINFTVEKVQLKQTEKLEKCMTELIQGENLAKSVFMGRLGYGKAAVSRSTRLSLNELIIE